MKLGHVLVALAAFALPASAQQVVFQDGFESGVANWTATGLWQVEESTTPCGSLIAPFPDGIQAARFGAHGLCHFNGGPHLTWGSLNLNDWVTLPDSTSISLRFWMASETEYCWLQYDIHSVTVQVGEPGSFTQIALCADGGPSWLLLPWHERRIDLSAHRGRRVRIGFEFDAVDVNNNNGLGWFVDDVRILAEPGERVCPSSGLNSGCPCLPWYVPVAGGCRNSTHQSAVLFSSGSVSVATDSLQLRAEQLPPMTVALLSQSTTQQAPTPFGDGLACTGGPMIRLGTVHTSNGVATWPAASGPSISQRGQIPPAGGLRFYSVFYRDALTYCEPATFNLTETQRIQWLP